MPPSASAEAFTIAAIDSPSPVSTLVPMTRGPDALVSSATVASMRAWSRAASATSAPSRTSSRAMAFPIPRLPPVTGRIEFQVSLHGGSSMDLELTGKRALVTADARDKRTLTGQFEIHRTPSVK
jgi:hypothetical protein